jgi:hypothetical protein
MIIIRGERYGKEMAFETIKMNNGKAGKRLIWEHNGKKD